MDGLAGKGTAERRGYEPPAVTYHGTVRDLTLSHHVVVGTKVVGLASSFAASTNGVSPPTVVPGPGGGGGNGPITSTHGPGGQLTHVLQPGSGTSPSGSVGGVSGSGAPGGGASAAAGGGGKELPFTGLAVISVAGVGAALASAGGLLRRVARRAERPAA